MLSTPFIGQIFSKCNCLQFSIFLTGQYGSKYTGAVTKKESLITEENGFVNIGYFKGSPFGAIDVRDKEHQKRMGL